MHGHKMAQLVDGKAQSLFEEFEHMFHEGAGRDLMGIVEFQSLSADDSDFALGLLSHVLMLNASSFDRRIRQATLQFPHLLLGLARVRPELPDPRRQSIAKSLLERARAGSLDGSSMKVVKLFRSDLDLTISKGTIGVRLYICLRALRRLVFADVRENERINKGLKLLGQRCPNASLDLVSSRTCLKYILGVVGALQQGLDIKTRKWSVIAPLAEQVADTCLECWQDATAVLEDPDRWAPCKLPEWLPSKEDVVASMKVLDPQPLHNAPQISASNLVATHANQSLFQFHTKGGCRGRSQVQKPQLSAIAFVSSAELSAEMHCSFADGACVYFACETRNRAVRLLPGTLTHVSGGFVCKPIRPWTFEWAAEVAAKVTKKGQSHLSMVAFPLRWYSEPRSSELVGKVTCSRAAREERRVKVVEVTCKQFICSYCIEPLLVACVWLSMCSC